MSMRATVGRTISRSDREIFEPRELPYECKLDDAGRAIALFADDDLRNPLRVTRRLAFASVLILAIDEDDYVRVLLEGARFAEVRKLRAMIGAGLRRATELRQD